MRVLNALLVQWVQARAYLAEPMHIGTVSAATPAPRRVLVNPDLDWRRIYANLRHVTEIMETVEQYRLGKKAEARSTFARLTEAIKNSPFGKDEEAQGFLREAAALIQEKTVP
jgi:hypothetical protein